MREMQYPLDDGVFLLYRGCAPHAGELHLVTRKRGRPPKSEDEGLHPLTILVPLAVKLSLKAESKLENRPLSEIVRRHLARYDDATGWLWALDEALSPRARAIGRLTGFVANELMRGKADLSFGLTRLLAYILTPDAVKPSGDPAAMIVDYWWLTMYNAESQTFEEGVARLLPAERKALSQINKDLVPPSVPKEAIRSRRPRRESK